MTSSRRSGATGGAWHRSSSALSGRSSSSSSPTSARRVPACAAGQARPGIPGRVGNDLGAGWTRDLRVRRRGPRRAAHRLAADRDARRLSPAVTDEAQVPVWYPRLRQQLAARVETGPECSTNSGDSGDGASETRTRDLLGAIQALSQLSYSPERRLLPRGCGTVYPRSDVRSHVIPAAVARMWLSR